VACCSPNATSGLEMSRGFLLKEEDICSTSVNEVDTDAETLDSNCVETESDEEGEDECVYLEAAIKANKVVLTEERRG
jgi:hypothetical protein